MVFYRRILASNFVPWRLRHGLENWVESAGRSRFPALYRWLHFGRAADIVRPVTSGPLHHFFGYYDKSPWNKSGRFLLAHEVDFNDRAPVAGDRAGVGVVHLNDDNRFERLSESRAWNWQQGSMAQWHPADPERLFVHNDCRDGRFVGVVRDVEKGDQAVYERPIYALLPDGRTGFSLEFARLAVHRPGYGYAGCPDPFTDIQAPAGDGIWRVDLDCGRSDLIVSLADLAGRDPKPSMSGAWHYVNHIQPSRGGQRIAFFHIWHREAGSWEVRLYTCRPDGSELSCLLDTGFISHYDWRDDDTILVWANRPGAHPRFLMLSVSAASVAKSSERVAATGGGIASEAIPVKVDPSKMFRVFGESSLVVDGHCTFSPDGRWVLNDTYPDAHQMRTLMLVRAEDEWRVDVARLYSPKSRWWGEVRCDLHPRWSRDGRSVCIDSVHNGTRQIYVVDVAKIVK